jgi:hypothetical protein
MLKKFLAGATTALLALGLVSLVAAPASAHSNAIDASVACNSADWTYTITWTITNSESDKTETLSNSSDTSVVPNGSTIAAGGVGTYTQSVSSSGKYSLSVTGHWSDGYQTSDSGSIKKNDFPSGCQPQHVPVTICHATPPDTAANGWQSITIDDDAIVTSGHTEHSADIIPSFSYWAKDSHGVWTKQHFDGQNWDAAGELILNNGCATVPVSSPNPPSFGDATCTAYNQVGQGSVTIPAAKTGIAYRFSTTGGAPWTGGTPGTTYPIAVGATVTVEAYALPGYSMQSVDWSQKIVASPNADHCVVTVTPTANDSVCTDVPGGSTQARYTIPSTTGVVYYVNGKPANAGTVLVSTFPQSVTVTAQAVDGYAFPPGTTTSWPTFTFDGPGDCRVLATASADSTPSVCTGAGTSTDPSFTLGGDTNVTYVVTINGAVSDKNVAGSTYTVGKNDTVTIDATPKPGYKLYPDVPFHEVFSFVENACLVNAGVSTQPTFSQTTCNAYVPGGINPAAYTLYAADHISYEVSTNGVDFTAQAVGTWNLTPGQHVWIHALADPGYILVGPGAWDFTSADLGTACDYPATPATPNWVNAVCHDARPGHTHATYTVVAAEGVHYKVSTDGGNTWTDATPGVVVKVAPDAIVWVQPFADPGYQLTDSSTMVFEFVDPGSCEKTVDYTQPTATDATCTEGDTTTGSYTLADAKHVTYNVRVNGVLTKDVAPGTYTAAEGDRVVVIAIAAKGWNFGEDGVRVDKWKFHFTSDGLCDATPVEPTVTDQTCSATGPDDQGVYTNGEIDVPSTPGVQYRIDGVNVDAGATPVEPGDHTVAAIALTGYKLVDYSGPWTLTRLFAEVCG